MTREAKIGMLTGLGVIVAIGVLLSEYLGDRNTGPTAVPMATGKMAPLPVGESYRQQQMSPVSVPAMTPAGGGERTQLAGGGEISSPIATGSGQMPPTMFATDASNAGPSQSGPVTPIAAGSTLMDGQSSGGPPTFTVLDTVPVKKTMADGGKPAAVVGTTYTIQGGDTLAKIAKKFYNSTKNSDMARIVAANPGVLKDATSMLAVNKKILIPTAPAALAAPVVPAVAAKPVDPGLVSVPGGAATDVVPIPGVVQPPKKDGPVAGGGGGTIAPKGGLIPDSAVKTTTYVVQAGDTLEKIARRIAPSKVTETVTKLTSLNSIKDPSKLKVGQTLKVPA